MIWSRESGYRRLGFAGLARGSTAEEEVQFHNRPPPLYLQKFNDNGPAPDPTVQVSKPASGKVWAAMAAGTVGLGLVLLSPWKWQPQPSAGDGISKVATDADPRTVGRDFSRYSAQNSRGSGSVPAAVPGPGPSTANVAAASGAVIQTEHSPEATEEARQKGAVDLGPMSRAKVQSATAEMAPQVEAASSPPATGEPQAAAPAQPPPPVIAPAPPQARPAPAVNPARPIRREAQWVGGGPTNADNPSGRYQGTLAVRVTVQPGGRVSHCVPVRGSGNAGLDVLTCRLVRERAQFNPAIDEQGRPVVSQAYTTFVWGRRPR